MLEYLNGELVGVTVAGENLVFADGLFLGHDLLAWLMLAVGGALVVGNLAAIVRPPEDAPDPASKVSFRRRAYLFIAVGAITAVWAAATLLSA